MPTRPTTADDEPVWTLLLFGALLWLGVAVLVGVVIGRSIRLADEGSPQTGVDAVLTTARLTGLR